MACSHDWTPSHNHLGLFIWKCSRCSQTKEAHSSNEGDRIMLLAYAQRLGEDFYQALDEWQGASCPSEKKNYRKKVHSLYWVTQISYLRAGIEEDLVTTRDLTKMFPCPPELSLIYSLLSPPLEPWDKLAAPIPNGESNASTNSLIATCKKGDRGKGGDRDAIQLSFFPNGNFNEFDTFSYTVRNEDENGLTTFPNGNSNEFDTSSRTVRNEDENGLTTFPNGNSNEFDTFSRTVRKKRLPGQGSGGIIVKQLYKGKNAYTEHWFRYEEKDGRQRSRYIPKSKVDQIIKLNEEKRSIKDILEAL